MFKFEINQEVWFIKNDKIHHGYVRVRQYTESQKRLIDENKSFSRDTYEKVIVIYALNNEIDVNWQFRENQLFPTKAQLLDSL